MVLLSLDDVPAHATREAKLDRVLVDEILRGAVRTLDALKTTFELSPLVVRRATPHADLVVVDRPLQALCPHRTEVAERQRCWSRVVRLHVVVAVACDEQ